MQRAELGQVIRAEQRDRDRISEYAALIKEVVAKVFGPRALQKFTHALSNATCTMYYLCTTFSQRQTLGEEYTGTFQASADGMSLKSRTGYMLIIIIDLLVRLGYHNMEDYKKNKAVKGKTKEEFLVSLIPDVLAGLNCFVKAYSLFGTPTWKLSAALTGTQIVSLKGAVRNPRPPRVVGILLFVEAFTLAFNLLMKVKWRLEPKEENFLTAPQGYGYCIICSCNMEEPSAMPCGHVYCWRCITSHLSRNNSCPMCKKKFGSPQVVLLQNY